MIRVLARARLVLPGAALALALLSLLPRAARAEEEKPVDLLRLPAASVVATTAFGGEAASVAALADGKSDTVAEVAVAPGTTLDVVYGFGDAEVAPQGVRVTLPDARASQAPAARVEVLVSTVSAHAGFTSVRADPLDAAGRPRLFPFPPIAARFILVRLTPAAGATRVAAAEVEVLGFEGEPKSRYAFGESPARAFDVLARLEKTTSLHPSIAPDERALFDRARQGRLDRALFEEAALLASGVTDPARRKAYVARLDELEEQAREAVASAKTPAAKGEALLKWMHAGPMSKGYVANQTDLSTVLDTGTFNCVSSATLFNVLALGLGLDARAIEVPTHAFSILYEGTNHMDVETTTPQGFNPARDPAVAAKVQALTGFRYIPDAHRDQRREVREAGLAAIIYYNHGVRLGQEKRYHEALMEYFRAMSLDEEFGSAVKNALAVLANWGVELQKGGKYEQALEVVETGLALAPEDALLRNNQRAIWSGWANDAIDAGHVDDALAILGRAARAVPDAGFGDLRSWVFLKRAEKLVRESHWTEALAAALPGLDRLEGGARDEIVSWRSSLYARWFTSEVRQGHYDAAAQVIEQGLAAIPDDAALRQNAGYLAQEWARARARQSGPAASFDLLRALRERFPAVPSIALVGASHVQRVALALAKEGKEEEALAVIESAGDLLPAGKDRDALAVNVFDLWAKRKMAAKAWLEAAQVYASALGRFPQDRLLRQNTAYLAQEWTRAAYAHGGADEAAEVQAKLKQLFPDMDRVASTSANELRRQVNDLVRAGKHAEAIDALDRGRALFTKAKDATDLYAFVYDAWARAEMSAGHWEQAADVYVKGLEKVPGERTLVRNVAWLTQQWAAQAADPEAALVALQAMRERFPDDEGVKRAARNRVQQTLATLASQGKGEEGVAFLARAADLLPDAAAHREAAEALYDTWARSLSDAGHWQEAVDVYAAGIAAAPDSRRLSGNAIAIWDRWAKTFSDAKDWNGAIAVYDHAIERFPGVRLFEQNKRWCLEQAKR